MPKIEALAEKDKVMERRTRVEEIDMALLGVEAAVVRE